MAPAIILFTTRLPNVILTEASLALSPALETKHK